MTQTLVSSCPQCDEAVALQNDASVTELVTCASCETELEVVSVDPPALALAPEIEEDWGE